MPRIQEGHGNADASDNDAAHTRDAGVDPKERARNGLVRARTALKEDEIRPAVAEDADKAADREGAREHAELDVGQDDPDDDLRHQ